MTACSSVIGPQLGRRRLFARSKTDHSCYSAAVDMVSEGQGGAESLLIMTLFRNLPSEDSLPNHLT